MTMGPPSGPPMDGATADSLPSSAASTSEYAVPSHHAPIITPTTLRTDNSVTAASPIGDNSISPTSSTKYASTNHQNAVSPLPCGWRALHTRTRNARPATIRPSADFSGLLGFRPRRASHGHNHDSSGASSRMNSEPREVSRSEEHTSELQSLMRTSYAVSC